MRRNAFLFVLALAPVSVMAQDVVSARAGLIHEVEGNVQINGEDFYQEGLRFKSMKEGDTLSTTAGRAEILLNAGSIVRVGEDSSFRLVAASLTDTKVKLESGMIIVEVADLPKETSVTLDVNGHQIALRKRGLYEFAAEAPSRIRVYEGELAVANESGEAVRISKERQYDLDATTAEISKFDSDSDNSALYRWGARRARTIMAASQTTPRTSVNFNSAGTYNGVWAFNPQLGMYGYIQQTGNFYSPYVNVMYVPSRSPTIMNVGLGGGYGLSGGNYSGVANPSYSGSSGSGSVSSAPAAAPAAAAPAPAASAAPSVGGGGGERRR